MTMPIITSTLPTIIGMGVVSQATDTMFGKGGRRGKSGGRSRHGATVVAISPNKAGAENYATGYRKALKKKGIPYIGRVKVKKVSGGYAVMFLRGG